MKKSFDFSILSSILGVVISILIIVWGISTYGNAHESFIKSNIEFGADFYTEIFEEVEQITAATRGIKNAVYRVGGLLLISLGGLGLCYFAKPVMDLMISNKKVTNLPENAAEALDAE